MAVSNGNGRGVSAVSSPGPTKPVRATARQWGDELLGAYDAFLSFSYKLAPFNPDSFINERGYKALEDQLHLAPVRSSLDIIRDSVLSKGWTWEPAYQDELKDGQKAVTAKEIADALTWDCNNIIDDADNCQTFRSVIREKFNALQVGFHVQEIIWQMHEDGPNKDKWGFKSFAAKPARQIGFDLDRNENGSSTLAVNAITSYTPSTGYQFDIPPEKCLLYTYEKKDNLPYGNPLGRVCYKNGWSWDFTIRFLNICIETVGVPFIMAFAPKGAIEVVRKVLTQFRQGAPPVLPYDAKAELQELGGTAIEGMLSALKYHDQAIKMTFLHSILTSGEGEHGSTSAGSDVHADQQQDILDYVQADIEECFTTQLARRWTRYNYGPEMMEFCPKLSLGKKSPEDKKAAVETASQLVTMGAAHEEEPWIREGAGAPPISPEHKGMLDAKKQEAKDLQDRQLEQKQNSDKPPVKK